jgi:glycine/D-amino acid oxidase-like deaminating enzyme
VPPVTNAILTPEFTTDPYWWEAAPRPARVDAALPEKIDVAVVGSGLTGLSAALTLARAGREVLVLEAERTGEGATTRNAGFIGRTVTIPFSDLVRRVGTATATAVHEEGLAAVRYTTELIEGEQIQCHYRVSGRFTGAETARDYRSLAEELAFTQRHVSSEARMVPRDEQRAEIGSDHYHGGLLVPGASEIHPALYHQELAERALSAGAMVADHAPVLNVSGAAGNFMVTTGRGAVMARDVLLATNAHTDASTPHFRRRLIPVPAYMLATEPLAPEVMARLLPNRRTVLDTKNVFRIIRTAPDGSRILFGGRTGSRERGPADTAARLHKEMVEVFPELGEVRVSHCWNGALALTFDRLPHIGAREGVHFVLGYNGAGVPTGTYLGHKAALKILGAEDAPSVFEGRDFPTLPFYRGRPWFLPAAVGWYRLKDALKR